MIFCDLETGDYYNGIVVIYHVCYDILIFFSFLGDESPEREISQRLSVNFSLSTCIQMSPCHRLTSLLLRH